MTPWNPRFVAFAVAALATAACNDAPKESDVAATKSMKEIEDMFRKIEDNVYASPQISLADVETAKAQGITVIVNNRPDGEDPGAPQSADIQAAATAAGIEYVSIPITHAGFSRPQIDAMRMELDKVEDKGGKILAYCRSGTRSTLLWSLAEAAKGNSPRVIAAKAADAGYDVAPIQMMLDTLAGAASE